jgi:prepilin-type N-terminal cleavage/methylation domain-containing protein
MMDQLHPHYRKGLTLIETVIGLAIIGIAFYSLMAVFVTLAPRTARIESVNDKVYLANEKMEEYLTRSFAQLANVSATPLTGTFSDYNYQIVVTYVATSDLNTAVGGPTQFKNVKVRVWGSKPDTSATVEVVSLVSSYETN